MRLDASLVERVATRFAAIVPDRSTCVVAVSGGPDSLALLDLLHQGTATHGCELVVGHVDHGLDPASGDVAARVEGIAAQRGLEFEIRRLSLAPGATETEARRERRRALRAIAVSVGARVISLAHHADDQAETVLLRLLRGSGPAGLRGMSARQGVWVRPLLGIRRIELVAHLERAGIVAWIDPANSDRRHLRSWLRHDVMPLVESRLPDVVDRLLGAGRQAGESRAAWAQLLDSMPELELASSERGISVAATVLQGYRSALRHAILAALGRRIGVLLGSRRLDSVDRLLASGSGSGEVALAQRYRAELAFGRLTLYRMESRPDFSVALEPGSGIAAGPAHFDVSVAAAGPAERSGWSAVLVPGRYAARGWQPGDRIRPLGGAGSRAVAVLLREARIPPGQRATWPVVVSADDATIVWVPGICRADSRVPTEGAKAWRVECALT